MRLLHVQIRSSKLEMSTSAWKVKIEFPLDVDVDSAINAWAPVRG